MVNKKLTINTTNIGGPFREKVIKSCQYFSQIHIFLARFDTLSKLS